MPLGKTMPLHISLRHTKHIEGENFLQQRTMSALQQHAAERLLLAARGEQPSHERGSHLLSTTGRRS